MDTDVEVLKPLDYLLQFEGVSGFETEDQIPTGLMASRAGLPIVKELLDDYDNLHFIKTDGTFDLTTNVIRITKIFNRHGFNPNGKMQTVADFTLLPKDFLCPKDYRDDKIYLTANSLCIHHFSASWTSPTHRFLRKVVLAIGGHRLKNFLSKIRS